jgi:phospholipid transport system substrate-binding protein
MKRIHHFFKFVVVIFAFIQVQLAAAQSSPVPMLEDTSSQILATLKKNKGQLKKNHQIIYQAVQQYLLPHVDVKGMSRSVLGRQAWNNASPAEKEAFSKAFTQLVIRTYASPLAEYTDETVKFLPMRGSLEGRFTRVNSVIIRSNGQNIPLSYSLVAKNDGWKIYDLSVEGVSLLQSFRSQFGQILQNASMKDLIAQMHKNSQKAG